MPGIKMLSYFTLLLSLATASLYADTASLLILYTNDMHDYIKPGPDNLGGVPYLAGYVKEMRSQRDDIMLLDGGDVMEKGDLVAYLTKSRIMYEAMGRMGYTAGAVGNHDIDSSPQVLQEYEALAGYAMLCLNHFDDKGNLVFTPSTIVEVNKIRVGIMGMTNIRTSVAEDGARLSAEAKRLEPKVDLLVVVAHIGSKECARLSAMAPQVDLFLSAHTHEVLKTPVVVPETKALIVQAGHYAQYVGRLDVTVDLEEKKFASYEGSLVEMAHDKIVPDKDMIDWIAQVEQEICPEATEVVGHATRFVNVVQVAALAAAAIRDYAQCDIAFCHTAQIMRSGLFAGDVDVNDLFRTGGQRGADLLACNLTAEQIETYVAGLVQEKRGRTEWAGFKARLDYDREDLTWSVGSTLERGKLYRVIMTEREWVQRFLRVADKKDVFQQFDPKTSTKVDFTFTHALAAYARKISEKGESIDAHTDALIADRNL